MKTHTPTPWKLGHRSNLVVAGKNTASAVNRTSVAHCMFTSSDSPNKTLPSAEECEANAAHIVRCVNNHDALCAALEQIAAYTKPTGMQGGSVVNEIARAVLAKVKEGTAFTPASTNNPTP